MRRALLLPLLPMALGAAVIALPDAGPRLFSLSAEHGPSALDGAGIVLLLAGFGLLLGRIVRARAALAAHLTARPRLLAALSFLFGLGNGLLLAGVFGDFWWWWLIGALLLLGFWLSLLVAAEATAGNRST